MNAPKTNGGRLMKLSDAAYAAGDPDRGWDLACKSMIASGCCCPECDEILRITRDRGSFICENCEHSWTEDDVMP